MGRASVSVDPDQRKPLAAGLRWAAFWLLILTAILAPFLLFENEIARRGAQIFAAVEGHPWAGGVVIVALLAGDVVLPVPSSLVSTFAGGVFGWALGAAVIWIGMTLGCAVGYALGRGAVRGVALRLVGERELARARKLSGDAGPLMLVLTRAVPVLAEASILAAGAARMPFGLFMAATSAANAVVAVAYAGAGAAAAAFGSFVLLFLALVAVPALAWWLWRLFVPRTR